MSRRILLERYNAQLDEEIDAKEAYSDKNSLRTIIKGKRDVGVIELVKEFIPKLEKYDLGVIPLRMTSHHSYLAIVYRDKEQALKLYKIASSKGSYLRDDTPDEAHMIGKLLGYTDKSISEYIRKKYGSIGLNPFEKNPDDYNNLHENSQIKRIKHLLKKMNTYFLFHWFFL